MRSLLYKLHWHCFLGPKVYYCCDNFQSFFQKIFNFLSTLFTYFYCLNKGGRFYCLGKSRIKGRSHSYL